MKNNQILLPVLLMVLFSVEGARADLLESQHTEIDLSALIYSQDPPNSPPFKGETSPSNVAQDTDLVEMGRKIEFRNAKKLDRLSGVWTFAESHFGREEFRKRILEGAAKKLREQCDALETDDIDFEMLNPFEAITNSFTDLLRHTPHDELNLPEDSEIDEKLENNPKAAAAFKAAVKKLYFSAAPLGVRDEDAILRTALNLEKYRLGLVKRFEEKYYSVGENRAELVVEFTYIYSIKRLPEILAADFVKDLFALESGEEKTSAVKKTPEVKEKIRTNFIVEAERLRGVLAPVLEKADEIFMDLAKGAGWVHFLDLTAAGPSNNLYHQLKTDIEAYTASKNKKK